MRKILVTGGAGFIGAHLVDKLIKSKYKVLIVDHLKQLVEYLSLILNQNF